MAYEPKSKAGAVSYPKHIASLEGDVADDYSNLNILMMECGGHFIIQFDDASGGQHVVSKQPLRDFALTIIEKTGGV